MAQQIDVCIFDVWAMGRALFGKKEKKENKGKNDYDVTPVWMVLLHFLVGISLDVIPKWALRELQGPQRLLPLFEGHKHLEWAWTSRLTPIYPKGKPQGSHIVS